MDEDARPAELARRAARGRTRTSCWVPALMSQWSTMRVYSYVVDVIEVKPEFITTSRIFR